MDKNIMVLSTGELTKVIIICLLLKGVNTILLDESLEVLDPTTQKSVLDTLNSIEDINVVFVTHNKHLYNGYECNVINL